MGVFDDSASALAAVFESAAGETVTYSRGTDSLDVTAWRSPQPLAFAVDTGGGALVEYESWEWHLRPETLGDLAAPQPGDKIVAEDGRTYEVLAIPGQGCCVGDSILRIHTKRIADAET